MSTKTTIKRVALVAVAALGLGMVSSVGANAAAGFNATYSGPTTLKLLTGYAATDAGTIQVDLAGGGAYGALQTSDSATVTLTANDGAVAKDGTFLTALSLATANTAGTADYNTASTGYNNLNNGTVAISGKSVSVTTTTAGYASASGKVYLKVAAGLTSASSGAKVKYTLTTSANGVIQTFVSTLTLTIDKSAGTTVASPSTYTGTINIGGSGTATLTQPYSNVPASSTWTDNVFSLTGAGAASFNVTATATGGSITLVRDSATQITATAVKNALDGDFSVTYTITVNALSSATAGQTVSAGGFTWTVQPYTPTYSYSTVSPVAGTNGYYASAASGGDGIVWGLASDKTNSSVDVSVVQKDQFNTTIAAAAYAKTVTATITGKGSLSAINNTADVVVKSKSWSVANGQLTSGTVSVSAFSEGVSGEGTLTIAVDGTTVKTYTLRFLGDAASITATLKRPIGSTSGAANGTAGTTTAGSNAFGNATASVGADTAPAVVVKVLDSNGWSIPTAAPTVSISDVTVIASSARSFIDSGISDPAALKISSGTFAQNFIYTTNANASGKTATITYSFVNAAGTVLTTTPVTVTLGGAVAKASVSFDAATYVPGQAVTLTFAGLDSSGNKAYDGQDLIAGGIESTLDFGGANTVASGNAYLGGFSSAKIVNGVKTRSTFAPLAAGDWTITGYLASGASYTGTASVGNASADAVDAANEATDAANAATDAANAAAEAADAATAAAQDAQAAVAALATQVASLIAGIKAQITTLTNLVVKIQKKVKA